ncbi:MAG: VOC family protein [Magnetospirillum sp.]|nr:VOC family protein [Magnetospirillum sp.]
MISHITGLDHVIIAVRDLERAASVFRALGFTLASRGEHAEWGTANTCIMFGTDYLELLAAVGEGGPAERVRAFTADHEGLMGLVWGSTDAAADAARLGLEPPGALSRSIDGDIAHFVAGILPPDTTPGIASFLCQHLTPEKLRRPGWTEHANGALEVVSVTALMAEPLDLMPFWDRLIGPAASTATDETVTVHSRHGMVFLCRPDDLGQLHPEADADEPPAPPAMVALTLRVADTDAAAGLLRANGISFDRDRQGRITIPPEEACGVMIELVR